MHSPVVISLNAPGFAYNHGFKNPRTLFPPFNNSSFNNPTTLANIGLEHEVPATEVTLPST